MSNTIPTTKAEGESWLDGVYYDLKLTVVSRNGAMADSILNELISSNYKTCVVSTVSYDNATWKNDGGKPKAIPASPSEQAARDAVVLKVLKEIEWNGSSVAICPSCVASESEGHSHDCQLAALIHQLSSGVTAQAQADKRDEITNQILDGARMVLPTAPCYCGGDFKCTRCLTIDLLSSLSEAAKEGT